MFFVGKQYVQMEKILFEVLPLWIALALHKLVVRTLAFVGIWLLMRRISHKTFVANASVAATIAVSHDYEIAVAAPQGGVVIVNTVHWPWWRARADGIEVPALSADNGIHVAIPVPAGARTISLGHHRPLLRENIWGE